MTICLKVRISNKLLHIQDLLQRDFTTLAHMWFMVQASLFLLKSQSMPDTVTAQIIKAETVN